MINYVKIKEDLYVVQQVVKSKTPTVKKRLPVNHIWIYDRSGSMTWVLPELTEQLIQLTKKIPKGDSLSLGWFSGEGDFNFVFKGFKITEKSDYVALEKSIRNNSDSRNTTCFSEILAITETVIADLSVTSDIFSLHFFTDGYPVVSNHKKEIDNIFSAISKIKGKIHTAMFVGYGAYYNKDLMTQMAEKLGALLIHSSLIPEYSNSITKLVTLSENTEPKTELKTIIEDPICLFTITDQGTVLLKDDNGSVFVTPQTENTYVYYVSASKPKKDWKQVKVVDVDFNDKKETLSKALYASALVLTQQMKTDVAMEIMGQVGDKNVIDDLTNAFTTEEYGATENSIAEKIHNELNRFTWGRVTNYLPPADAFCVFDLLNMLVSDSEAAFYPYHEKFDYERIGAKSVSDSNYPTFKADARCACKFENLTWHESRLNISVLTKINGTIKLNNFEGKKPKEYGFPEDYPVFIWRNYTFVKDGRVHTKKFYVTSSEATYKFFKDKHLVVDDSFNDDKIYCLDISKLPSINRKIATGKTSATELCKLVMQEQQYKAKIKALKFLKDEEFKEQVIVKSPLKPEQIKFLESNGIVPDKEGLFQPPTTKEKQGDQYMAKYFEINIVGMSSLPPVKKVIEKLASKKNRTPVESLVEEGIKIHEEIKTSFKNKKLKLTWFETTIKDLQIEMKEIRVKILNTKFAIILGKKWFDEFTTRDNCELVVDGTTFKFVLGEEPIEI